MAEQVQTGGAPGAPKKLKRALRAAQGQQVVPVHVVPVHVVQVQVVNTGFVFDTPVRRPPPGAPKKLKRLQHTGVLKVPPTQLFQ